MNLFQCQNKAKKEGYDEMEFIAIFPKGPLFCKWVDAYFGR